MTAPAYLVARGFPPHVITEVGWRVGPLGDLARRYGLPVSARDALAWWIPYRGRDGRDRFERIRLVNDADIKRFGGGKYRQPAGVQLDLYDAFGALDRDEPADVIVLVEGEANAVATGLLAPGLPVVGLPGQRALRPDLAARLAGVPVVYLWLDRDEPGYRDAVALSRERLTAAGIEEVLLVDSDDADANEVLAGLGLEVGHRVVRRLLDAARPSAESGAALLRDLVTFVRRFVAMSEAEAVVVALWIVHTHALDAADTTPYLAVTSAEKRSGKTRLLEVLERLVARPLSTLNTSDAALFRSIGDTPPTLLFDEIDAIFGPRARDREDLRGMLNAGYRRGATVRRCVGDGSRQRVEAFPVFCAKALAGIGKLPDTVADRSLPVRLRRRARGEPVERARYRRLEAQAEPLRLRVERWAAESLEALEHAEPALPDALDDRGQDVAEPLLAIADLAGGGWAKRARGALVEVRGEEPAEEDSLGVRLLADVRSAFENRDADRLPTTDLIEALIADEEAPWRDWKGKGLTPRSLADLLRPYGIRSRDLRLPDDRVVKGYRREQLTDAWARYLRPLGPANATPLHPAPEPDPAAARDSYEVGAVADTEPALIPLRERDVADVAALSGRDEPGAAAILTQDQLIERLLTDFGARDVTDEEAA